MVLAVEELMVCMMAQIDVLRENGHQYNEIVNESGH
jgi:hypothetical protein